MKLRNPFYKGGPVWVLHIIIDKGTWHISWHSLFHYHDFSLTTPKPLTWFFYITSGNGTRLYLRLMGFTLCVYNACK